MINSYDSFDALGISQGTTTIEFDTVLRASYSTKSEVTSHPIEKGAPANDHVRVGQDRATFEAMVSNTPMGVPNTQMRGATGSMRTEQVTVVTARWVAPGIVIQSREQVAIQALRFDGEFDRVHDVHEELRKIQQTVQLVRVQTSDRQGGLLDYEDVVIENLTATRDAGDGSSQTFNFDIVKLKIVETRKVNAPDSTKTRAQRGKKGKKEVKAEEKPALESVGHALATKVVAALGF